jgi:vanillate O-demethylase ferredoxin subunit
MTARLIMKMNVVDVVTTGEDVHLLTLQHPSRPRLPDPSPGSHVDVRLPDGKIRQYSLCGDPDDATTYKIAVKREPGGRGGSRWIHENLIRGAVAHVSAPRNNFRLAADASRHVLIGGGIGITPLAAMAHRLSRGPKRFTLHYCAKSPAKAPLLAELRALCGDRLRTYFSAGDGACRFDAAAVLAERPPDAHLYCCGPKRLVEAVRSAAGHWPRDALHFEFFAPLPSDDFEPAAFEIRIASTGRTFQVPADRSALDILRQNGYRLPSSCELGVCGTCECGYTAGTVIHRDGVLEADARRNRMLPCVSRAEGRVVLDL